MNINILQQYPNPSFFQGQINPIYLRSSKFWKRAYV